MICKTYSVNIHKEFMNRNQGEVTYFLSIVTISSVCIEAWRRIFGIFIIKMSRYFFCRFLECICCVTAQECTFSVHGEHNVFYSFKYYSYVECGTKITGILGYLHMEGLLSCPYSCEGESEVGV